MGVTRHDAIVVGGGPAGLSAATALAQAGHQVLLLEKESFGGWAMNLEWVMNYPAQGEKAAGNELASRMIDRARECGVRMEIGEVVEVESYSRVKSVTCRDGRSHTGSVLVLAGGLVARKLGVPGEQALAGKGMIHCAACDAALYAGKTVAVCGGGRAGIVEALLLARHAAKVFLIEAAPRLSASPALQERARADPKLDLRCGTRPVAVRGEQFVTGLEVADAASGVKEALAVDGVLVHVGFDPATNPVREVLALDEQGYIAIDAQGATGIAGIFAAGDIRRGSARSVAQAASDGAIAAAGAREHLAKLKQ